MNLLYSKRKFFQKFYQKCFCCSSGSGQASVNLRLIHALNIRLTTPDYLRDNAHRKALLSALEDLPDHPEFLLQLCQVSLVAGYKCKIMTKIILSRHFF